MKRSYLFILTNITRRKNVVPKTLQSCAGSTTFRTWKVNNCFRVLWKIEQNNQNNRFVDEN